MMKSKHGESTGQREITTWIWVAFGSAALILGAGIASSYVAAFVLDGWSVPPALVKNPHASSIYAVGKDAVTTLSALAVAALLLWRTVLTARRTTLDQKQFETTRADQQERTKADSEHATMVDYRRTLAEGANLLNTVSASSQIAGALTLLSLGDLWVDGRTTCLAVIVARLRGDVEGDAALLATRPYSQQEDALVNTIVEAIAKRYKAGAKPSWSACELDLRRTHLGTRSHFVDCQFDGPLRLGGAVVDGELLFRGARFREHLSISGLFVGRQLVFKDALVSKSLTLESVTTGGTLHLGVIPEPSGRTRVSVNEASVGGQLRFRPSSGKALAVYNITDVETQGVLNFSDTEFSGSLTFVKCAFLQGENREAATFQRAPTFA